MKKNKLAKILTFGLAAVMALSLASCGGGSDENADSEGGDITVISREEGSGTRDAFVELTGIMQDDVDRTIDTAEISNSTSVVTQSVAGNEAAIGYISMGSLDDSVKALKIGGVEATVDNVKSGDYALQRPFNIVTKGEVKELPQDFINFIMSAEGQGIIEEEGYISTDENIFTDEKTLTKYLMFGEVKEDQYYTVQEGDTIDSIAYKNKLATEEFLIVNPEFTSANNILSVGQQVKVGLINPIVDVVVETHNVMDQESKFKTVQEDDSSLDYGTEKVVTEGQNGVDRLTTKIKSVNGETNNVVIVSSETITPSVDKVVKVGTKTSPFYAGGGTAPIMSGSWAWPTISQYYISSHFGYRWGKIHEALDIAGSGEGSPIYAAGSGTVVASLQKGSLGNYVTINHGNGYYTLYGHMHSRLVVEGQTVQKGQQIGTMGHTGFATGTHLHFGLYRNGLPYRDGIPTDPMVLYK